MAITNVDLRLAYLAFNKKYFGNQLPKDMPVYFSKHLDSQGKLGRTSVHVQTFRPQYVEISSRIRFSGCLVRLTLLHEMCHVENPKPSGHGKWFNGRMKKLAKDGAFDNWW